MKVLSVISYYRPHWTGMTSHAVRVAEALVSRGHEVTVLTTQHTRELPRAEAVHGVEIVRLRPIARFSRGMIAPSFPFAARKLIANSDVVQIHTPLPEAWLVAILCRAAGRPLVMTHHGDVVMPPGVWNRWVEKAAFRVLRFAARRANVVTSYSDDYARHSTLLSPFLDHLVSIPPPVTMPRPDPKRTAAWREQLGLGDKPVVGVAGRWVREKGLDYLLEAMPRVRERLPDAHFVFAGERDVAYERDFDRCKKLVDRQLGHVTLLELLRDPRELANFYAMCDVVALPSRTDMFALVQVEAMLCGTPVVATDIPGARVVVRTTGFGRLVAPNDPDALASGLVDVLSDPARYRPNPDEVRTSFDAETTYQTYERVLEAVIEGKRLGVENPSSSGGRRSSFNERDHELLDQMLRGEADMAFRRRTRILLDYMELRDGNRVLDCGCGQGFHSMAMGQLRAVAVVGVDIARCRLVEAHVKGVPAAFTNGDLASLPFASESFDALLMSETLEHVKDDRGVLANAHRVLKPGGVLAISVPHARYPFLWDPINWVWTGVGGSPIRSGPIAGIWTNHEVLYEPAHLVEIVRDAGFDVEVVEEATHFAFPFSHFAVYGIGKPLLERKLLPSAWHRSADRFQTTRNGGSLWNPVDVGVGIFRLVDRLNDRPAVRDKRSFVNVLVKARKR